MIKLIMFKAIRLLLIALIASIFGLIVYHLYIMFPIETKSTVVGILFLIALMSLPFLSDKINEIECENNRKKKERRNNER